MDTPFSFSLYEGLHAQVDKQEPRLKGIYFYASLKYKMFMWIKPSSMESRVFSCLDAPCFVRYIG